jgi:hypothetical protein
VKSYPLLKLGAQEQETKVAPSTKNAQPSSVSEIFQCVPSGLFWMGLAVKGHPLHLVWGPRGLLPDALPVWQLNYKIFRYIASFS